jgi:hypothetical protein
MDLIMTILNNQLSQEEIDNEINLFMSPRYFLKAPIDMMSDNHGAFKIEIDVGEEKLVKKFEMKEITYKNGRRNNNKLF